MNRLRAGVASGSGSREMPWRCKQRCRLDRVRPGIVACKAYKQSSRGRQRVPPKGDDDGFLLDGEHGWADLLGAHAGIAGGRACAISGRWWRSRGELGPQLIPHCLTDQRVTTPRD